jgi:hypothetical protein
MKATLLINFILASSLGFSSTYAGPIEREGENQITAYFNNPVRSPGEVALFYDAELLSTISLYGSVQDAISWSVQNKIFSCEKFEEKIPHLYVTKNGTLIKVARMTCQPLV